MEKMVKEYKIYNIYFGKRDVLLLFLFYLNNI